MANTTQSDLRCDGRNPDGRHLPTWRMGDRYRRKTGQKSLLQDPHLPGTLSVAGGKKKNSSTLWTDLTLNLCLWISNGHSAHIIISLHFFKVLSSNFTPLLLSLKHLHHSLSLYTKESYPHQKSLKIICYPKNISYLPETKFTHSSVSILR